MIDIDVKQARRKILSTTTGQTTRFGMLKTVGCLHDPYLTVRAREGEPQTRLDCARECFQFFECRLMTTYVSKVGLGQ